jgi:hypothetical protein
VEQYHDLAAALGLIVKLGAIDRCPHDNLQENGFYSRTSGG